MVLYSKKGKVEEKKLWMEEEEGDGCGIGRRASDRKELEIFDFITFAFARN